MAGREHQAQKVVANIVIERSIEIGFALLSLELVLAPELLLFSFECYFSADEIDRAMLRAGH